MWCLFMLLFWLKTYNFWATVCSFRDKSLTQRWGAQLVQLPSSPQWCRSTAKRQWNTIRGKSRRWTWKILEKQCFWSCLMNIRMTLMMQNLSFANHLSGQRKVDLVVFHCHLAEWNMKYTCVGWRNSCEQFENVRMTLSSMLGGAARAVQAVQPAVRASWIEESKGLQRCQKLWGGLSVRAYLLLEPWCECPRNPKKLLGFLGTKHFY